MKLIFRKFRDLKGRFARSLGWLSGTFEGRPTREYLSDEGIRRRKIVAHYVYNFVFSLLAAFALTQDTGGKMQILLPRAGEIADRDIISPLTAEVQTPETTKALQKDLERNIAPVFDFDDLALDSWLRRWELGFQAARRLYGTSQKKQVTLTTIEEKLTAITGQTLTPPSLQFLHKRRFAEPVEKNFMEVGRFLNGRIIAPHDLFNDYYNTGIQVRLLNQAGRETFMHDVSRVWSLDQAREYLGHIRNTARARKNPDFTAVIDVVTEALVPNLKYNEVATKKRVAKAVASSKTAPTSVKRGQVILERGERVTEEQVQMLNRLMELTSPAAAFKRFSLSLVLLFIFFSVLFRLNIAGRAFWNLSLKDALVFLVITILSFLGARYAMPVLQLVFSKLDIHFGAEYLLPISTGAIIIHLTMGKETAFTFATLTSIATGYLLDQNFYFTVYSFAVMASAIQSIRSCKQRSDLYRCGAWSGTVGALLVLAFSLSQAIGLKSVSPLDIIATGLIAFSSGMLSAILTSALIPIFEVLFGYTTSLKLLELSNFNHPLLHSLMLKAPGTYHHSVLVGSLAELAADRIKANSLLARVSSYYHDIGKMTKPMYFIENQTPNNNPHDHLTPTMSAKILFSHVKNGVRLGREHNLGAPICNIIEQHHGTTLVSFFYNKAKKAEIAELDPVEENEFRYPGPRPQTREAAIVMLADACEAATRSINEPTAAKIQTMVHNIITRRFLEEQFSECELTLRDLQIIEDCFVRTLVSLYHHRIEYPGQKAALGPQVPGQAQGS